MDIFIPLGKPVRDGINDAIDFLVINFADGFEAASNAILVVLLALENALSALPPWLFLTLMLLLSYSATRKWHTSALLVLGLYAIGCFGLWDKAMQTIAIMLVSIGLSTLVGLPLGVWAAHNNKVRALLLPLLDLMQTIPSFVYLIPAAMLFGLGKVPAIFATFVYATAPLIRLTDLGIRGVDGEAVEASRAFGASPWQTLSQVQIPLALPSIMQGVNQTLMMALAMVVVASMIGARGLGETVLFGLQRNDSGTGFLGGIAIVILAIVFDRITQSAALRAQKQKENP